MSPSYRGLWRRVRPGRTLLMVVIVLPAILAVIYVYQRVERERAWLAAIEQTRVVFEPAMAAYFAGRNEEASQALRSYLGYLESSTPLVDRWAAPAHPFLDAQRLAMERTVTTTRLAIVEERLGQHEAAASTWARAAQHATAAAVRNVDPESLKQIVVRLDEATPR